MEVPALAIVSAGDIEALDLPAYTLGGHLMTRWRYKIDDLNTILQNYDRPEQLRLNR